MEKKMLPVMLCRFFTIFTMILATSLFLSFCSNCYGQRGLPTSNEVEEKLKTAYSNIKNPEISLEKFIEINKHVYSNQNINRVAALAAAAQDPYCSKIRSYCTNGDFETGLDQAQYVGAYGFWYSGLYPDPFSLTYGFNSGSLYDGGAHQTIVNKSSGNDPITGISVVPSNGGNQSLRVGNAVNGYGTELIAKTITVDPNESILNFYYAVVFQDPGHARTDQPAFSVRAYDCATGQELPNVCDLGNGSNIAVSDARNPFFKSKNDFTYGLIAFRDWSLAQINLSKYVGKNVIIVFTNKDCNLGGHFGYTYLDNLFSNKCPAPGTTTTNQGSVSLADSKSGACGIGNICAKYTLPYSVLNTDTTFGDITITLDFYQNNTVIKTINSPKISTYSKDSSYCFSINPAALGLNMSLGGFDYTLTGRFTLSGFSPSPIIVGNPGPGVTTGLNNDYLINCPIAPPIGDYYSKSKGDLHNVLTWGVNMDGSGANPADFGPGKTFHLVNRVPAAYTMTANWTIGGKLDIPSGSQLNINGHTLSEADLIGTGTLYGSSASNLIVTIGTVPGNALNFASGGGALNNLTLNRTGGSATVGTGLDIYGVLTVTNGTLNTGSQFTLKSNASNTARVAPVAGAISGNVVVERYIPPRRAWRIMSAPVGGSQTINAAWQEGATTSSSNPNPHPGFGTHITEGTSANGFDHNPAVAMVSIKKYISATDTWTPLTNTNATNVNSNAYLLFVRGDRSIPLGYNNVRPNSTVLRATGPLKTGNQTFTVSASGFTAIPNPFASPINFATITRNNVPNNFYLWDPKLGGTDGVGGYVLLSYNGSTYTVVPAAASPESQYIQSGQGFMVQSTGVAGSLVIKESDKSATAATNVFRSANNTKDLRINLQIINSDNTTSVVDEVLTSYSSNFSNSIDERDAIKAPNINENLAIVRESQNLMLERRSEISGPDTIKLSLSNTSAKSYLFEFSPQNLSSENLSAVLLDRFMKTSTPIDLSKVTRIYFNLKGNGGSSVADRFLVVLTSNRISAPITVSKPEIRAYPNPISGKAINLQLINQPPGNYNIVLINTVGQVIYATQIQHSGGLLSKSLQFPKHINAGIYQLRVTNGGNTTSLKVISN